MKSAYIDVRGPWPIFIMGMSAITLEGFDRSTTVEEVFELFNKAEEEDILDMFDPDTDYPGAATFSNYQE
jgi:hypothetical protein